jgi:K+-transporting ATPase KdpF subunit
VYTEPWRTCFIFFWRFFSLLGHGHLRKLATVFNGVAPAEMTLWRCVVDYVLGGIASLVIFIYLFYALLKPEKF